MHTSVLLRLRPVLVGGLALLAVASAPAVFAAPGDQVSQSAGQRVSIDSFSFGPADVTVPVGGTLTWSNVQAGVPHTSTSADGLWDSGVLSTGDTFSFTFNQVGDFAYQCNIHPSMRGVVHVTGDSSTTATPDSAASTAPQAPTAADSVAPTPASPPTISPTASPTQPYGY
jgi:plastocyanin